MVKIAPELDVFRVRVEGLKWYAPWCTSKLNQWLKSPLLIDGSIEEVRLWGKSDEFCCKS